METTKTPSVTLKNETSFLRKLFFPFYNLHGRQIFSMHFSTK